MADQAINVPDDLEDDATPAPVQADDTAIPETEMETEPDIQPTSEATVAAPAQPARTTYSIGGVAISLPSDLSDADRAKLLALLSSPMTSNSILIRILARLLLCERRWEVHQRKIASLISNGSILTPLLMVMTILFTQIPRRAR